MTPYVRLLAAQVAIGAAAIFARFALTGTGALGASALRLVVATVPIAVLSLLRGRPRSIGRRNEALLCGAGVLLAVHFAAWIGSLRYTSVAISTLLVCTSPVWTGIYDWLVRRRRLDRPFVAALGLGAAGLALVATRRDAPAPVHGEPLLGAVLALVGGLAIGAYLLVVQSVRDAYGAAGIPVRRIVVRTYAYAAAVLIPTALLWGDRPPPLENGAAWFGILAMALVSQLIGHTALNAALRDFSPSTVALSTLLEPVAAAVLAGLIFHEAGTPLGVLGAACILGAIGLAARSSTLQYASPEL